MQKCCVCELEFSLKRIPRILLECQHNICQICIRKRLISYDYIECGNCFELTELPQRELQSLPKNINLIKFLKQIRIKQEDEQQIYCLKNSTLQKVDNMQSQKNGYNRIQEEKQLPVALVQTIQQFCSQHEKEMELICINDRVKICQHCAIFGTHRGHETLTINEVNQNIMLKQARLKSLKIEGKMVIQKMKGQSLKNEIIDKLSVKKHELQVDLKKKFKTIYKNLEMSQKQTYRDLADNFKNLVSKVNEIFKEQTLIEKDYKVWQWSNLNSNMQEKQNLQKKIKYYYEQLEDRLNEGEHLMVNLSQQTKQKRDKIQNHINSIHIEQYRDIQMIIFNAINIKKDQQILTIPQFQLNPSYAKNTSLNVSQHSMNIFPSSRKSTKVQFGNSQMLISRNNVVENKNNKKNFNKFGSVNLVQPVNQEFVEKKYDHIISDFYQNTNQQGLDLTDCNVSDQEIFQILSEIKKKNRKLKILKLVNNKLTNRGFKKIIELLPNATNINLSYNNLTDEFIELIMNNKFKMNNIRIINLTHNNISLRKVKNFIEQLKKKGLIITI